ncbi:Signal transduction histidine kinase [Micromonospora pattaloongensis]|uniref:histidine kinase n=1 Tax=Micromonospora pattaloongensis TaxID=405436 RepID=A0A1H3RWI0_9ACTN|nr:HAMP domain-containing sensor histidine kinase [Micromonospora pattaloongensis]SDZ29987.1 Signal transduction histidine kinase [Micromonospora pattaloongensis]
MRSALARSTLAVTSMLALAFGIPLALLAGRIAHDRALSDARQQATGIVAALAVTQERPVLARAIASTRAGQRLALHLPGEAPIGATRGAADDVRLVRTGGQPLVAPAADGVVYLQPTALGPERTAVIEVWVPAAELRRGVTTARLSIAGLAAVLVLASIALADRLGARVVTAARELSRAARRLGAHDLSVRVRPAGPTELVAAGTAFNVMADRIVSLVDAERERAADLSHRLRTPLTALRLDADSLPHGEVADRVRESIDALEREVDAIIVSARDPLDARTGAVTDLVDVLADRLAFWAVPAEHQGRAWEVIGGAEPVWIPVPRSDVISAVDAMLGNVFRHTPAGTPFRIGVGERELVVEDGGPGIADRSGAVRRGVSGADSTGLGLDIVRRVATEAGGSLRIGHSSRLGGARVGMSYVGSRRPPG